MRNKRINEFLRTGLFVYLFIGLSVVFTGSARAACIPVYGGGPTCTNNTLTIQKQVRNPSTNRFVHNLGTQDPRYQGGQRVTFQIILTNNSDTTISKIIVKDAFPTLLTFVDGPGVFDKNKQLLTFEADTLAPHRPQQFSITAQIATESNFPVNTSCVTNTASALPSTGSIVQDSSQFCVEKISTTPATGPEAFEWLALLPIGIIGLEIKRIAKLLH